MSSELVNKQSQYKATLAGKQSECDDLAKRLDIAIVDIKEKESAEKQSKVEIQRVREQLEGEFDRVGKELLEK